MATFEIRDPQWTTVSRETSERLQPRQQAIVRLIAVIASCFSCGRTCFAVLPGFPPEHTHFHLSKELVPPVSADDRNA